MGSCPTPTKARFTRATATTEATRIRADVRGPALEPYRCPCGYWHLRRPNLDSRMRAALARKDW